VSLISAKSLSSDVSEQSNKDCEDKDFVRPRFVKTRTTRTKTVTTNKDCEDEAGFCGEPFADNGDLLSSLSPLTFSLKFFGLYFHREDKHQRSNDDPESKPATTKTSATSKFWRVFSTIVLVFVWFNAIRFISVFALVDKFGILLLTKIMFFSWFCLIATLHTAFYVACHTGKLHRLLTTIRVTQDCVSSVRRAAVVLTAMCWISVSIDLVAGAYLVFNHESYDFLFTPFVVLLPKDKLLGVKVIGYLGMTYIFPTAFFSHALNLILVYVFYSQFRKMKKNFSRALGEEGEFSGDLSVFRRRHQTLSRAVSKMDDFMKFNNVGGFVFHIVNIIEIIYLFTSDDCNHFAHSNIRLS